MGNTPGIILPQPLRQRSMQQSLVLLDTAKPLLFRHLGVA